MHLKHYKCVSLPFLTGLIIGIGITAFVFEQKYIKSYHDNKAENSKERKFDKRGINQDLPIINQVQLSPRTSTGIHKDSKTIVGTPTEAAENDLSENLNEEVILLKQLYVGVITAEKYLQSRAKAVNNTWGSQVDKLQFFAEQGSPDVHKLPIVNLEGISDTEYPPQKKAFRMIKHMCNYIDEFQWFVRADDDVYIRVEKLRKFLEHIDGDKMIYMGQPGHGVPEARDKLGLKGRNFCMGGPGVFLNRKTLKALCPHIDECMQEVVSGEEDVEIGRCISNHIGIECTHAWDALKLFYHSYQEEYTEEKPFLGNLAENKHIEQAITLHHVKVPYIMYRIHRHFAIGKLNESLYDINQLKSKLQYNNYHLPNYNATQLAVINGAISSLQSPPSSKPWLSFDVMVIYGLSPSTAVQGITNSYLADLKQICETAIDSAIGKMSTDYYFNYLSGGYFRSDPTFGTEYMVDVVFSAKDVKKSKEVMRVKLIRPLSDPEVKSVFSAKVIHKEVCQIFLIIPVTHSQAKELEYFLTKYFEHLLDSIKHKKWKLIVILSMWGTNNIKQADQGLSQPTIQDVVNWYRIKIPDLRMEIIEQLSTTSMTELDQELDQAYTNGYEKVKSIAGRQFYNSYVVFNAVNMSLSESFINTCIEEVELKDSSKGNAVQAIPFQLYSSTPEGNYLGDTYDSSKKLRNDFVKKNSGRNFGFWNFPKGHENTASYVYSEIKPPLCTSLMNLSALFKKNLKKGEKLLLFRQIYNHVLSNEFNIFRYPDKEFINFPIS